MRVSDDEILSSAFTGVNLILGAHDHIVWHCLINGVWCLKSGTDFKTCSTIDLYVHPYDEQSDTTNVGILPPDIHTVTSAVHPDDKIAAFCAGQIRLLGTDFLDVLAVSPIALDGRFVSIRTTESPLGNFICDALAHCLHSPIALINSDSFRSDTNHPPGDVTRRTIDTILPSQDYTVVV